MESFLELALKRRSVRKYTDQKIDRSVLDTMLQTALAAPCSKHLNEWEFVVLTDKEALTQCANCRTYGSQMLAGAAAGIVVCLDAQKTDTWQCDGAIAAEHLLLAAADLGLGACWMQVYGREGAEDLVRQVCQLPQTLTPLCIVSIGYPAEEKKPINPEKLQYNKIHYGKFESENK